MKNSIIAALIGAIAIGSALGAFAATRTIQTEANVEVRVWQHVNTGNLYLSTRPEGGEWVTHDDEPLDMSELNDAETFYQSSFVVVSVPIEVEVEVPDPRPIPTPTPRPTSTPTPTPQPEPGTCCEVRGMGDLPAAQEAAVAEMQEIIAFADREYNLTHSGPITINISHTNSGLAVRYRQAFGERLETLPSTCSFQRGEHVFFGPECRADRGAFAREWIKFALGTSDQNLDWVEHGTFDYFASHYLEGKAPNLKEDRFQRVVFFEEPEDLGTGRAGEELMTLGVVRAIHEYGRYRDWLAFYRNALTSGNVAGAFEEAFDASLGEYYLLFEAWAADRNAVLRSTAFESCEEASRSIRLQGGQVGVDAGYPDYRVPLEPDLDGDGLVCEGYFPQ